MLASGRPAKRLTAQMTVLCRLRLPTESKFLPSSVVQRQMEPSPQPAAIQRLSGEMAMDWTAPEASARNLMVRRLAGCSDDGIGRRDNDDGTGRRDTGNGFRRWDEETEVSVEAVLAPRGATVVRIGRADWLSLVVLHFAEAKASRSP